MRKRNNEVVSRVSDECFRIYYIFEFKIIQNLFVFLKKIYSKYST